MVFFAMLHLVVFLFASGVLIGVTMSTWNDIGPEPPEVRIATWIAGALGMPLITPIFFFRLSNTGVGALGKFAILLCNSAIWGVAVVWTINCKRRRDRWL